MSGYSIFKCIQHTIRDLRGPEQYNYDVVRGDILQAPHKHLTPAVGSWITLIQRESRMET